jgi:hypothetical protein
VAGVGALHHAMALSAAPLVAAAMRAQPLPDDVLWLFQIAAADGVAVQRAVDATGASADRVREAAALYIQHVVFAPDADHYRILAVTKDAPQVRIREHFGWLMKWLHPDRLANDWESKFAQRVIAAWNDLKLADRRAAYDSSLPSERQAPRTPSGKRRLLLRPPRGVPLIALSPSVGRARFARAAVYAILVAIVVLVVLAPRWAFPPSVADGEPEIVTTRGGL